MPDPTIINCEKNKWMLIASDQIYGYLFMLDNRPSKYLYTYRMTGNPAPTEQEEGVPIFISEEKKLIFAFDAIDIYIMAVGNDGKIRYDWTM